MEDAVKKLKGKVGTKVNVTVIHPSSDKKEKVDIDREVIQLDTVLGDHRGRKGPMGLHAGSQAKDRLRPHLCLQSPDAR